MTVVDNLYIGKFLNDGQCLYEKLIGFKSLAKNTGVENKLLKSFSQFCIITVPNWIIEHFHVRI